MWKCCSEKTIDVLGEIVIVVPSYVYHLPNQPINLLGSIHKLTLIAILIKQMKYERNQVRMQTLTSV